MELTTNMDKDLATALDKLHVKYSGRIRIRRSFNYGDKFCAGQKGVISNSFQCPEQTGKVNGCAECMLCVYSRKNVHFIDHGKTCLDRHTTIYPKSVQSPYADTIILKDPANNKKFKIDTVTKGIWKGRKIRLVAGIERQHCPRSCHFWDRCYGNNMPFQHRFNLANPLVQKRLYKEALSLPETDKGYAIRLHIVGDFPTLDYISTWDNILSEREDVNLFGFTALPINVGVELW